MTDYHSLHLQLQGLIEGVEYPISNLSNAAALLWQELENINWAGFYQLEQGKLILGPFQGKPACTMLTPGKGVCGTAVQQRSTQRVADVHKFSGHIACDCASNSEIVVPIWKAGEIWGVLDIDSPVFDRFSAHDQTELEAFVKILETGI